MNAIFIRTSVRSYEERTLVETEKIERILKAAMKNLSVFTIIHFGYPIQKNPQQSRYDETRVHYVK